MASFEMAPFDFAPLTRRYAQDERCWTFSQSLSGHNPGPVPVTMLAPSQSQYSPVPDTMPFLFPFVLGVA